MSGKIVIFAQVDNYIHMLVLDKEISRSELSGIAESLYGDMVKGVVDVERGILAIDAELHSDLEGLLLSEGSSQESLWGINLYPDADAEDLIEYDSLINIRPRQGNNSRDVENPQTRKTIEAVVLRYIKE